MSDSQQQDTVETSPPAEEKKEPQPAKQEEQPAKQQQQEQQPTQQQQKQHEDTTTKSEEPSRPSETRGTNDTRLRTETRGRTERSDSRSDPAHEEKGGGQDEETGETAHKTEHQDESKEASNTTKHTAAKGESKTESKPEKTSAAEANTQNTKSVKKQPDSKDAAKGTSNQKHTDNKNSVGKDEKRSKSKEENTANKKKPSEDHRSKKGENKGKSEHSESKDKRDNSPNKGKNDNSQSKAKKDNSQNKGKTNNSQGKSKNDNHEPQKKAKKDEDGHGGNDGEEGEAANGRTSHRSTDSDMSEGRHKQKEFFKLELQRLETGLRRESSKIQAPPKKAHMPYVFNTLEPYYNTYTTRFLIELPDEVEHGHTSRKTAQGLTDPWMDLRMDRELPPVVSSRAVSRQVAILKREKEIRDRKKRSAAAQSSPSRKGGSTRLPKFPVVNMETRDLATKQLYYSDVPALRHELKTKYSSSAQAKVNEDYERTHQDFYRMELDKLNEVHPINRKHMTSAYFAYLQNTPGSKKAIGECVRNLRSGKA